MHLCREYEELIAGRIAWNLIGGMVTKALDRGKVDPSLRGFLVGLVKVAVLAFAVIAARSKFGVQTTSFTAVLGAAGFAVGLALQGSLPSFAAGVMIVIFRPIQVGDLVESSGHLGILKEHPKVLAEPAPTVAVSGLGDSSVDFVVRPWCKAEDFDAQGVSIPFPQRDVSSGRGVRPGSCCLVLGGGSMSPSGFSSNPAGLTDPPLAAFAGIRADTGSF